MGPLESGWAQIDEAAMGPRQQDAVVCVLHPARAVGAPSLPNAHPLPSGALEADLGDGGTAFALQGGVAVVARGSAIATARSLVARSPAPPPPLWIRPDVKSWTFTLNPQFNAGQWQYSIERVDGSIARWSHFGTEAEAIRAERAYESVAPDVPEEARRVVASMKVSRSGTDVYVDAPPSGAR